MVRNQPALATATPPRDRHHCCQLHLHDPACGCSLAAGSSPELAETPERSYTSWISEHLGVCAEDLCIVRAASTWEAPLVLTRAPHPRQVAQLYTYGQPVGLPERTLQSPCADLS